MLALALTSVRLEPASRVFAEVGFVPLTGGAEAGAAGRGRD